MRVILAYSSVGEMGAGIEPWTPQKVIRIALD